jgi:hypothetical protein
MTKATVAVLAVALVALAVPAALAADGAALPDGLAGFRAMVKGTIVSKAEGQFVIKVAEIVKTLPTNKATNAQAAVGKELTVVVKAEPMLHALAERKVGETVVAGLFNSEGNTLTAIEQIRKADGEAAPAASPAPAAGGEETAKLKARISEMEKTIKDLRAENERLRKQLADAAPAAPK